MAPTPFDTRELVVLISAAFVFACSLRFRGELRRVPSWQILNAAIVCLIVGGAATVVEHFTTYELFNVVEHVAYLCQSLLLAVWALRIRRSPA